MLHYMSLSTSFRNPLTYEGSEYKLQVHIIHGGTLYPKFYGNSTNELIVLYPQC